MIVYAHRLLAETPVLGFVSGRGVSLSGLWPVLVFTSGSALKSAMNNTSVNGYALLDTDYTDVAGALGTGTGNNALLMIL